jgi:hypothetical protein
MKNPRMPHSSLHQNATHPQCKGLATIVASNGFLNPKTNLGAVEPRVFFKVGKYFFSYWTKVYVFISSTTKKINTLFSNLLQKIDNSSLLNH